MRISVLWVGHYFTQHAHRLLSHTKVKSHKDITMKKIVLILATVIATQVGYAGNCNTDVCFDQHVKGDSLNLSGQIDADDVPALVRYLTVHPDIKKLDISVSQVGDEAGKILAQNTTLVELNLFDTDMKVGAAKAFAQNSTLKVLNLDSNDIDDEGAIALASNSSLISLDIGNQDYLCAHSHGLTDAAAKAFANNTTLKKLDLSFNYIHSEGAAALANNNSIESLNLMANYIDDVGIAAFATNTAIKKINLTWSDEKVISGYGFIELAKNKHIEDLAIQGKIGYEILHAFANNETLRSLILVSSALDNKGVVELVNKSKVTRLKLYTYAELDRNVAMALAQNQNIKDLALYNAVINDDFVVTLAANATINSLDLSNRLCANTQCSEDAGLVSDIGAIALAANKSITKLDLYGNKIGDQGAIALAGNTTLRELNIGKNKVGSVGLAALRQSTTLEKLYDNQSLMQQSPEEKKKMQKYLDIIKR